MLKLKEVRKEYKHDKGIHRVNITVNPGNLYLFVGENGSGKSTTIKLISNVIFNSERDGKIINEFKKIIYLPDKRTYPKLLYVLTFLRFYLSNISPEVICEALKRYNLENTKIGNLSKGMYQKVGIIQTILSEGDLYLLDEPTDGLDVDTIATFKEDVKNLVFQNKAVVISTHNKNIFKDLKPIIYTFKEGVCNEKKQ